MRYENGTGLLGPSQSVGMGASTLGPRLRMLPPGALDRSGAPGPEERRKTVDGLWSAALLLDPSSTKNENRVYYVVLAAQKDDQTTADAMQSSVQQGDVWNICMKLVEHNLTSGKGRGPRSGTTFGYIESYKERL